MQTEDGSECPDAADWGGWSGTYANPTCEERAVDEYAAGETVGESDVTYTCPSTRTLLRAFDDANLEV